ncbi:hypothetical protein C3432_00890 [Citrobacter amalonaticus]|uniref:Uncharacterized protein n=1 Tax=Citrobacter amalonaticus TaxID=35703 RepID=A0A2S4S202_CITAM|nr:hypothetical protein C3432_00890 [Citrobacter amalonaticus]POT77449.1 hypothetical protein C3436_08560 [Citrobacter amalonaticus]POU67901.1 hypothetical protein C3430_02095 [Citrobacter amalonaticus]POV07505.1 hypothetical protein C3424_02105 [Citrobacter amalonaticus]
MKRSIFVSKYTFILISLGNVIYFILNYHFLDAVLITLFYVALIFTPVILILRAFSTQHE